MQDFFHVYFNVSVLTMGHAYVKRAFKEAGTLFERISLLDHKLMGLQPNPYSLSFWRYLNKINFLRVRQEGRCEYSFNSMTTILLWAQHESAGTVKSLWRGQESLYVKRHNNVNPCFWNYVHFTLEFFRWQKFVFSSPVMQTLQLHESKKYYSSNGMSISLHH
jgi:hypothetical protein